MAIKTIKKTSLHPRTVRVKICYALILFLCLLWCSLIILKPILAAGNSTSRKVSALITLFFSPVCHQSAERSFHIMGHPLAVCARCTGIYLGFLLGIIIHPFFRKWHRNELPSNRILFAACIPTLGVLVISRFNIIEENALLRSVTGLILGGSVSFFVLPALYQVIQNRNKHTRIVHFRKHVHNPDTIDLRSDMPYNS